MLSSKKPHEAVPEEKPAPGFFSLLSRLRDNIKPLLDQNNLGLAQRGQPVKFNAKWKYKDEEQLIAHVQAYSENAVAWVYGLLDWIIKNYSTLVKINFTSLLTNLIAHPFLALQASKFHLDQQDFEGHDAILPRAVDTKTDELSRLLIEFFEALINDVSLIPNNFPQDGTLVYLGAQKSSLAHRRREYLSREQEKHDNDRFGVASISELSQSSNSLYGRCCELLLCLPMPGLVHGLTQHAQAIADTRAFLALNFNHFQMARSRFQEYSYRQHQIPLEYFIKAYQNLEKRIQQLEDLLAFGHDGIASFNEQVSQGHRLAQGYAKKITLGARDAETIAAAHQLLLDAFHEQVQARLVQYRSPAYRPPLEAFILQRNELTALLTPLLPKREEILSPSEYKPNVPRPVPLVQPVPEIEQIPSSSAPDAHESKDEPDFAYLGIAICEDTSGDKCPGISYTEGPDGAYSDEIVEEVVDCDELLHTAAASVPIIPQPMPEALQPSALQSVESVLIEIHPEERPTSADEHSVVSTSLPPSAASSLASIAEAAEETQDERIGVVVAPPAAVSASVPTPPSQAGKKWLLGVGVLLCLGLMATGIAAPIGGTLLGLAVADVFFMSGAIPLLLGGLILTLKRLMSACFSAKKDAPLMYAEDSSRSQSSPSRESSTTGRLMRNGYAGHACAAVSGASRATTEASSQSISPQVVVPVPDDDLSCASSPTRSPR